MDTINGLGALALAITGLCLFVWRVRVSNIKDQFKTRRYWFIGTIIVISIAQLTVCLVLGYISYVLLTGGNN